MHYIVFNYGIFQSVYHDRIVWRPFTLATVALTRLHRVAAEYESLDILEPGMSIVVVVVLSPFRITASMYHVAGHCDGIAGVVAARQ